MKFFKWMVIGLLSLVVLSVVAGVALVNLVDWNNYRDTIQDQVKKQTGRDLTITGDLKPTVFPWLGVSLGEIELANAVGFSDIPFARMGGADVKVKLLPLIKKEINVSTIELHGLNLELQRAADGTSNWDDLVGSSQTEAAEASQGSAEQDGKSGGSPINALSIGGITISDANVSWTDDQSATDVKLENFNLSTGAVELQKPFDLNTDFQLSSSSMALSSAVTGSATVNLDLENEIYTVEGLKLEADSRGDAFPGGELRANLSANIAAELAEQAVDISGLTLDTLGLSLTGALAVANLDTAPAVSGQLSSNDFDPRELFQRLGIEAPDTADEAVLKSAKINLSLKASADSAQLDDLSIQLDDTTFSGNAQIPSLAAEIPPLRFDFAVDAIDVDRYLPANAAASENAAANKATPATTTASDATTTTTGDEVIELPLELMRKLDIDGRFSVGEFKIKNLTTRDIEIPVTAKAGVIALNSVKASLYDGQLDSQLTLNASTDTPAYDVDFNLVGIQADPLLGDLMQKASPLAGAGQIAASIKTGGTTVNGLTAALNGNFNTSFTDGFIRGVNLGYQVRRAKAALSGKSLSADASQVQTDFTAMSVGGQIRNGVVSSDDLDMRSPLLRVAGAGNVDLPGEQVDYTLTTLVSGTSQGQGGEDLDALKGIKLSIPIRGSFQELSENFAGVIFSGLQQNLTDNLTSLAKDKAKQEAEKLKSEAKAKLKAEEDKLRQKLQAEQEKAKQKLQEQLKLDEKAADLLKLDTKKVEDKLKGLFK